MLKLSEIQDTYPWTVTVKMPNNGAYKKSNIKVIFNRLPHDERTNLLEQIQQASESGNTEDAENDFFNKVFVGWEKGQIQDENKEDLEVNAENKEKILAISEVRKAIIDGYFDSVTGDQVKQKN